ncbi:MAG: site-specific DNA-methyltransferase [Deltaproteobacteria bacterium]|nr:site-specific DNA-methyltransferase [Deltaproteobacteria bacterium]
MARWASSTNGTGSSNNKRKPLEAGLLIEFSHVEIGSTYTQENDVTLYPGDCLDLLRAIPNEVAALVVTSPPYNIGKEYEKRLDIETYISQQAEVIKECVRILSPQGSICWQVGNYVDRGAIVPLDVLLYPIFESTGLRMRNRIIWHFEHGLHCRRRFSGRYETIMWFTKTDDYFFNVDPVRVPQKYPGKKYFKGPKAGQYSCNPLGKNPGDVWIIPNVKHNHIEKTIHPCQFPVELVERLVLSMTPKGGLVFDPFIGVGSTAVAAILHDRKVAGAEIVPEYLEIAEERVQLASQGVLKVRPMNRPVYEPPNNSSLSQSSRESKREKEVFGDDDPE